jgi:hypothetical protein
MVDGEPVTIELIDTLGPGYHDDYLCVSVFIAVNLHQY